MGRTPTERACVTCVKCGGLLVREPVRDFFEPCVLMRCVQCGMRGDRLIARNRQANRPVVVERPTALSDEAWQDWITSLQRSRKQSWKCARATAVLKMLDYLNVK